MSVSLPSEVLSVENLDFQVPVTLKEKIDAVIKYRYGHQQFNSNYKTILRNINLKLYAGEFVAVIGASGSGKTSLINIIANKLYTRTYSGEVKILGRKSGPWIKHEIGYVTQEDVLNPYDTAREAIKFVADMRLPTLNNDVLIDRIMQGLGLSHVKDVPVGAGAGSNGFDSAQTKKGLSGGERKRVSIGRELVAGSKFLLLDECTSGLDINTANNIIKLLHDLSRKPYDCFINPMSTGYRLTVFTSIHQPSSFMWDLFDRIILMSHGYIVYNAPTKMYYQHINLLGIYVPKNYNPADFLVEYSSQSEENCLKLKLIARNYIHEMPQIIYYAEIYENRYENISDKSYYTVYENTTHSEAYSSNIETISKPASAPIQKTKDRYNRFVAQDTIYEKYVRIRQLDRNIQRQAFLSAYELFNAKEKYTHYYWTYFAILMKRCFLYHFRNPELFIRFFLQYTITSFFCGSLWWRIGDNFLEYNDKIGALFFVYMISAIPPAADVSVRLFQSRNLYLREHGCGIYGTGPFFFATVLADMPMNIIMMFYSGTLTFVMVGYINSALRWFYYCVLLIFILYSVLSISLAFTFMFRSYVTASVSLMIFLAITLVFAGPYINSRSIPSYWKWMPWFSVFAYSFRALFYVIVWGKTVKCSSTGYCPVRTIHELLEYYGMAGFDLTGAVGVGIGYMVLWTGCFMTVAYFLLRFRRFS